MSLGIKSLRTMTVYQLKLECKKMGIKRYSHLRKKELRELVENEKRKKEMEIHKNDKNIFCYPEILKEIYSFVDMDNTDIKRIEKIKNAKKDLIKHKTHYEGINAIKCNRKKRQYVLKNGYTSAYHILDSYNYTLYLTYNLEILKKSKKEILYQWLRNLEYKVPRKTRKGEMKKLVEKYYNELLE